MAVVKQFEGKPLQVVCTPEMRGQIEALADAAEISLAEVIRRGLVAGLPVVKRDIESTGRTV